MAFSTKTTISTMPRKFVSQGKLQTDRTALEEAFKYRVETSCSIRTACKQFGVKVMTLQDAFNRSKSVSDGKTFVALKPNSQKVFTNEQEDHISAYAIKIAKMFYGLPTTEFRRLVYSYAVACDSKAIPSAWEEDKMATRDWYYAFMARHRELKLKTPEGMSIARAVAFNRVSVNIFFSAYTEAMEKYELRPDRIYNLDETSLSTVLKPVKVVCERGQPVASQISQERGATMTFVGIINASGHYIPPVFIIPRKRWNDSFMRGTIDGSKGILHQNGWMNGECFLETLQHVHEKTYSSVENKILLIMDNAVCHMNIHAINYAIQHGIIIVTLPPHTTAKLQPLDVSVYGPFKTYLRSLQNDFTLMNPNTCITEHMLPEFASKAWIKSSTPTNILSGFAATGIWPINRLIFPDEAFAGAQVTERPPPQADGQELPDLNPDLEATPSTPPRQPTQEPSTNNPSTSTHSPPGPSSVGDISEVTPDSVRPFPKASARPLGKGRKKVRACILTENEEAIANLKAKEEKKAGMKKPKAKKRKTVPRDQQPDSDDEDDHMPLQLDDSSDYSDEVEDPDNFEASEYPFTEKEPERRSGINMDHFVSVVKEEEDAPSMIVSDSSLVSGHQARERSVEVNMDDFMLEIKEENEIKIEEEDMAAVVLTEDPLATHHQEASWKEITSKPNWNDSVKKTPVHRAEKLTKRPLRGIAAKAKVPQRRDDGPTPLLLATAETGNFGDAACPPMPPLDPLVISLIKSGKHQEEVNHLIQEVTEAYKAKKAAWQAMEKYYRDLNK